MPSPLSISVLTNLALGATLLFLCTTTSISSISSSSSLSLPLSTPAAATAGRVACASNPSSRVISRGVRALARENGVEMSRRNIFAGLGGAVAAVGTMSEPAQAGLFGPSDREKYEAETSAFLKLIEEVLAIPASDDNKKEAVLNLKSQGNRWVAKWRNSKMSSSPSFGNLYSVINAVNGHYNTFGPQSNLPKKRMARVEKEIADATKYLTKGR
uniref:Photosystem II Psb27 protein n=1 Tax=Norrisiella sphaerica TaxID=552664 RepID=A0A7S2QT46_9EUKA